MEQVFESAQLLQDPIELASSFHKKKKNNHRWQKLSSWGFTAWRDGLMVRYFTFLLVSFMLALYCLYFCIRLQGLYAAATHHIKFLYNGSVDPTPLDSSITYHCFPDRSYSFNSDVESIKTLNFYRAKWGTEAFMETVEQASQYICLVHQIFDFSYNQAQYIIQFYTLMPFTYIIFFFLHKRRHIPLARLFCREINIFEHVISILIMWLVLGFWNEVLTQTEKLDFSTQTVHSFILWYGRSHFAAPYFSGMLVILTILRFFFGLKVTRIFGPFTKMIKLNASSLVLWVLFTSILLLVSSNYLSILLSDNPGCYGLYECSKPLIEAAVGAVRFEKMGDKWSANFSFGAFTVVLAAVLVNMVIAKINNTYSEISKKGTLFYYKDLFDLRYQYKLDSKYGFLSALEHPFSLFLLPSLCVVKCLERRRKKRLKDLARRAVFERQTLQDLRNREEQQSERTNKTWKCCCCFKCRKVSRQENMQLEDFNLAMLRFIYGLHLLFISIFVFIVGLALIPLGYFCLVVIKLRLLWIAFPMRRTRENFLLGRFHNTNSFKRMLLSTLVFFLLGPLELFLRNFIDCKVFIQDCWNEHLQEKVDYSSILYTKHALLTQAEILQIIDIAKEGMKSQSAPQCQIPSSLVEDLNHGLVLPTLRPLKTYKSANFKNFADSMILPSLGTSYLVDKVTSNNSLIKLLPFLSLRKLERLQSEWVYRLGSSMFNLSILRRATLPLEVPLQAISKVLRSVMEFVSIRERFQMNLEVPYTPFLLAKVQPLKRPYQMRIANTSSNGSVKQKQQARNQMRISSEEDFLQMLYWNFNVALNIYNYDGKEIVFMKLQKVLEACVDEQVQEQEGLKGTIMAIHETLQGIKLWKQNQ